MSVAFFMGRSHPRCVHGSGQYRGPGCCQTLRACSGERTPASRSGSAVRMGVAGLAVLERGLRAPDLAGQLARGVVDAVLHIRPLPDDDPAIAASLSPSRMGGVELGW